MAAGSSLFGITTCMPILEQKGQLQRFFGTLCQDITLTDNVKYFNKDIDTKRLIF